MTDEPRISKNEARALAIAMLPESLIHLEPHASDVARAEHALAAFLRARVPERAVETETTVVRGKQVTIHYCEDECKGFNACRDLVLKGRE